MAWSVRMDGRCLILTHTMSVHPLIVATVQLYPLDVASQTPQDIPEKVQDQQTLCGLSKYSTFAATGQW